jgi:hypothetical protein
MKVERGQSKMNRRRFLGGAVGAVAGAAVVGFQGQKPAAAAPPGGAVKVLMDDVRHVGVFAGRGVHVGPIVESGFPFTHVGLHWRSTGSAVNVSLRTSADGNGWAAWQPLHIEAGPNETTKGETFATLVGAPRHRFIQYRVNSGADTEIDSVSATFINSADGPFIQSLDSGLTPENKDATPVTFTREEWGAEEWRRFDDNGNEIWPTMFVPHKKLVVHHTATSNSYATAEGAKAEVRAIYAYHATSLGWGDIGYNTLVDKFGNVYEGRYGREDLVAATREVLSSGAGAGHALHHNYGSSGISLLGTYTQRGEGGRPGAEVSEDTRLALVDVLAFEAERNDLDPERSGDYALWNWGSDPLVENDWNRGLPNISGHRDCQSTICPGGNVYTLLPALRAEVAEQLARNSPAVGLTAYPVEDQHTADSFAFAYSWQGDEAAAGYEYALEGWQQAGPGAEEIVYLVGFTADDRRLVWSPTTDTSVDVSAPESGHYTFHVRAIDGEGNVGYQDSRTLLLILSDDGTDDPEDPEDPGNPEDPEEPTDPGAIVLEAHGYKVRGLQKTDLSWSGATTDMVEISRDGTVIATVTAASGAYTDDIDARGGGSYTYQICEVDGPVCSNEVTITF